MPAPGPRTTYRYSNHFKATAVRLSELLLVEDHGAAAGGLRRGREQERRYGVAFEAAVFDALPGVAVERGHGAALERDRRGRREAEPPAEC